ncbi:Agmatine coumaroyltransferase-1 [Phytophthora nicotianae]|uniref:Agmatine coumaroyltransferase-1 n=1 Tax=Phytophthora nicotianae TaxID=4792 RepID=A0A0W8E0G1_PHYNI|nr:Agmatine coumaroyltransferase-1 [Phytophthora nicotianae]
MPPTQSEELPLPLTPEGANELAGCEEILLPLSPLDAMMHQLGVMLLYIFPPSTGYDLSKLQTSFITLVNEDYPVLIGELHMDAQTGVVSVKQTAQAREKGAQGIRFETNPSSSLMTEDAMQTLSWELMPTPRAPMELICVKGTLLSDGGLVVGVDASHTLLDGEGMFTFMKAWGQHYSDLNKQDRLVVNHDRHLLQGTGEPSKLNHAEVQVVGVQSAVHDTEAPVPPPTTQHRFHFTPSMMKKIKNVATHGESTTPSDPSYVSTIDAITGLFTALISQARGHGQDVKVTTAVNARGRLTPRMPENYAGNVIFSALSSYKSDELKASEEVVSQDTLVKLAQRVRGSIRQSDNEYLRDAINFMTEQTNLSAVQPATNFVFGPDIMYMSWVRTGMYEAEFKGMHPSLVSVPRLPFDGFVILSEPPRNSPGVDVLVFLECTAMEKLKELFAQVSYLHEGDEKSLRSTL